MTLAIKRIHNLPPHLLCFYTDTTQNRNTALTTDELKQKLVDIIGTVFLRASSTKPVENTAACMCKGKGTLLRTPIVIQPHNHLKSHFRHTETGSF